MCKENTLEMDPAEVKEIENDCSELDDIFKALHRTFEETSEKQSNLSDEMERCKRVCDEHLDKAKRIEPQFLKRHVRDHSRAVNRQYLRYPFDQFSFYFLFRHFLISVRDQVMLVPVFLSGQ